MYLQIQLTICLLISEFCTIQLVLDIPECNNCISFGVSVEGIKLHGLSDQSNKPSYSGNFSQLDSSFVYCHSLFHGHLCTIYSFVDELS